MKAGASWIGSFTLLRVAVVALVCCLGGVSTATADGDYDPWERVNRGIFWFNDRLDVYLLEPVAKGWDFVVPDRAEQSIADVFANAAFPIEFANGLLQAKPAVAGMVLARFVLNSTLGMAGLFDVASPLGLEARREDFGQTLGVWGIANGPYIVLPVLGPSTLRDAVGRAVDSPLQIWPFFVGTVPSAAITGTEAVNWRSRNLTLVRDLKRDAFDYYSLVRNAYLQNREAAVEDRVNGAAARGQPPPANEEDLYFGDFEDEP